MSRERPILFSAPMVRAVLEGRKTQTRRIVKARHDFYVDEIPGRDGKYRRWPSFEPYVYADEVEVPSPYGESGDRLWVKETFAVDHFEYVTGRLPKVKPDDIEIESDVLWRADGEFHQQIEQCPDDAKWRPSIFMPRWASRITLDVTAVRVERLQQISYGDATAEGIEWANNEHGSGWLDYASTRRREGFPGVFLPERTTRAAQESFQSLWESINGAGSWDANPWVWVVEFKAVRQ